MKRAERAVLVVVVVAVALLLRWSFTATAQVVSPLRADAGQYAQCAQNLVDHGVYGCDTAVPPRPDSFRSPGYPLLIAVCRVLGGERWLSWLLAVQVALGTLVVPLVYWLSRRFLPLLPSLLAAVLTALSPHLVVAGGYVLTETLTTLLLVLTFGGLAATVARRSLAWSCGTGLAAGALVLVNEALAPLVLLCAWAVARRHGWRPALLLLLAALCCVLPWQVRNRTTGLARTGGERLVSSLSHGSYPGMVWERPESYGFPYRDDPAQPAYGQSWAGFWPVFTQRVAERPFRHVLWYLVEKPVWLWSWPILQGRDCYVYEVRNSLYDRQPVAAASLWLLRWLHWPLVALALVGMVVGWRRRRELPVVAAIALSLVVVTATYAAFLPDPRYLVPFRPLVTVLSMTGLWQLVRVWSSRRVGAIVAPASAHSSVG